MGERAAHTQRESIPSQKKERYIDWSSLDIKVDSSLHKTAVFARLSIVGDLYRWVVSFLRPRLLGGSVGEVKKAELCHLQSLRESITIVMFVPVDEYSVLGG